ncbi:TonB-dependent receptor plug domain-containing protein [Phenylobacterium sp.]|uniref:TonB-dependent receptor plug domain-containing protein n=1 Tax=Phenylobacterium sp. TaxID=1871053 RepID=UPI0037839A91
MNGWTSRKLVKIARVVDEAGVKPRRHLAIIPLTVGCVLAYPAASMAQQAAPTALGEVVVTATRQEQALSRVPQSVAVLSNDAMTELSIKNVGDVVQWTPGVTFRSLGDAGGGSIAIRGVASSVGPATTGVYIGDVPIHLRQVAY